MEPGGGNIRGLAKHAGLNPGNKSFCAVPKSCLILDDLLSVVVMIFFVEQTSQGRQPGFGEAVIFGVSGLSFRTWRSIARSGSNTEENSFAIWESAAVTAGITQASGTTAENAAIPELSIMLNAKITPAVFFILDPFGDILSAIYCNDNSILLQVEFEIFSLSQK